MSLWLLSFVTKPLLAPTHHVGEYRHEALSGFRECVLDLGRYLPVDLAMDESVSFELAQLLGERGLRYAVDASHELAEALHLLGGNVPEDEDLPLTPEDRLHPAHGFAASHHLRVSELVVCHSILPDSIH